MSPPVHVTPAPLRYLREGLSGPEGCLALRWYDDAREGCDVFAREHGLPLARVVTVLALCSPRVSVGQSAVLARSVLTWGLDRTGGLLPCVRASLARYLATGVVGARPDRACKVRAFASAILGDPDAVVVDVWVARGLGVVHAHLDGPRYRRAADVVRSLAGRVGVSPLVGQAALWYGVRRAAGHVGGVSRLRIDAPALVQGDLF